MKRAIHFLLFASCILLLVSLSPRLYVSAQATRIIFLHHSCGEGLIEEGNVREGLSSLGYEFYDHGYNDEGLRDADGSYTGRDFDVPGDNTDPDGIAEIFQQPLHDPPDNTFSHLMQYDVIAFKSCYPTSNIGDDAQLNEYKSYYLSARDRMDEYPDKLFIVVTQPPQVPGNSDSDEGQRARALADWLKSEEFLGGHPNVFTFDFFGLLAGPDNFLKTEYRYDNYDGHPNERANREIGPLFVDFIDEAIRSYGGSGPRPAPPATSPPVIALPPSPDLVEDFESDAEWWTDVENGTMACELDTEVFLDGASSLRMRYTVEPDGWADCGRSFDELQDWSGAAELSIWLRSDAANRWGTLIIFSGDPEDPTPFEADFEVSGDSEWRRLVFSWSDFAKAEWVGDAGIAELDPARIIGYGFSVGTGDESIAGTLWVDNLGPITGEVPLPRPGESPAEPAPTTEPVAPTEELGEDDQHGPICGAAALPLGALGVFLVARRRRK